MAAVGVDSQKGAIRSPWLCTSPSSLPPAARLALELRGGNKTKPVIRLCHAIRQTCAKTASLWSHGLRSSSPSFSSSDVICPYSCNLPPHPPRHKGSLCYPTPSSRMLKKTFRSVPRAVKVTDSQGVPVCRSIICISRLRSTRIHFPWYLNKNGHNEVNEWGVKSSSPHSPFLLLEPSLAPNLTR